MDLRFGKEAVVGTLVIVAVAIFVFGTMWLSGRSIGNRNVYEVQSPSPVCRSGGSKRSGWPKSATCGSG
jgi:hypothetical protein